MQQTGAPRKARRETAQLTGLSKSIESTVPAIEPTVLCTENVEKIILVHSEREAPSRGWEKRRSPQPRLEERRERGASGTQVLVLRDRDAPADAHRVQPRGAALPPAVAGEEARAERERH